MCIRDRYKINSSVKAVLAQRLLRRVCTACSVEREITKSESINYGISEGTKIRQANVLSGEEKIKRKKEKTLCQKCNGIGYKGRVGTFELLVVNKAIKEAIRTSKCEEEIEEIAIQNDMLTLKAYAIELVKMGLTSLNELIKVC